MKISLLVFCIALFGCGRVIVDRHDQRSAECLQIAEDLSVLYESIIGHMRSEDTLRIVEFDSKNPPTWIVDYAQRSTPASGQSEMNRKKVRRALQSKHQYVVPKESVGKYIDRGETHLVVIQCLNAPSYCSLVGVLDNGDYVEIANGERDSGQAGR